MLAIQSCEPDETTSARAARMRIIHAMVNMARELAVGLVRLPVSTESNVPVPITSDEYRRYPYMCWSAPVNRLRCGRELRRAHGAGTLGVGSTGRLRLGRPGNVQIACHQITSQNSSAAFEARFAPLSACVEGFLMVCGNPGAGEALCFELTRLD